jgi:hypothetical protein
MFVKRAMLAMLPLGLSACGGGVELMSEAMFMGQANDNKAIDRGFDAKPLTELQAGIWIDPNGCHHWIIDDDVKGTWMRAAILMDAPCAIPLQSAIL